MKHWPIPVLVLLILIVYCVQFNKREQIYNYYDKKKTCPKNAHNHKVDFTKHESQNNKYDVFYGGWGWRVFWGL